MARTSPKVRRIMVEVRVGDRDCERVGCVIGRGGANEQASGGRAWREYTLLDFGIAQVRRCYNGRPAV
jgi:hypothetical protein